VVCVNGVVVCSNKVVVLDFTVLFWVEGVVGIVLDILLGFGPNISKQIELQTTRRSDENIIIWASILYKE
jgi:hypothetical protein